jgi:hypothetical protein
MGKRLRIPNLDLNLRKGNLPIVFMSVLWITFITVLDAAVVGGAVRMWRARQSERNTHNQMTR